MRKQPKQARSRETIEVLLAAGIQILARRGWTAFNTNSVAEAAGVSVGTIYQYFPNKLALLEAIRQRHLAEVLDALASAGRETTVAAKARALVDGLVRAHADAPALSRALLDDAPETSTAAHAAFEHAYRAAFVQLVTRAPSTRRKPRDANVAARMLATCVESAIHDGARTGMLLVPAFGRELEALVAGYLA
jgi:AcrR family transcriptional regulator